MKPKGFEQKKLASGGGEILLRMDKVEQSRMWPLHRSTGDTVFPGFCI